MHEVGGCVGGTGWRKLLKFTSSSLNSGKQKGGAMLYRVFELTFVLLVG